MPGKGKHRHVPGTFTLIYADIPKRYVQMVQNIYALILAVAFFGDLLTCTALGHGSLNCRSLPHSHLQIGRQQCYPACPSVLALVKCLHFSNMGVNESCVLLGW